MMNTPQSLRQWQARYPDEWLALRVIDQTPSGEPVGLLLAHHPDEEQLHQLLRQHGVEQAYVRFSGAESGSGQDYVVLFTTG